MATEEEVAMPGAVNGNGVNFEDFRKVATQAVHEHEDLQTKYKTKEAEVEELQDKLADTEALLHKLKDLSENAVVDMQNREFEIATHLERELVLKDKAVEYAVEMVQENKKMKKKNNLIKRQSMAIIQKLGGDFSAVEISLDDPEDSGEDMSPGDMDISDHRRELEELRNQVEDLKDQLNSTGQEAEDARRDREHVVHELEELSFNYDVLMKKYAEEKEAHEIARLNLKERNKTIEQYNRVSRVVLDEIEEVHEKYEEETVLRQKAEEIATQMYSEKKAADEFKRQSVMLLSEVSLDEKMLKMISRIEELTKELENTKQIHKQEVEDLKSDLEAAGDLKSMEDQLEEMNNKLFLAELRVKDFEKINLRVQKQLDDEIDKNKPFIPPPPPPPPQQINRNPLAQIKKRFGWKQRTPAVAGPVADPLQKNHEATIEEMLKRIKSGKITLKPLSHTMQADNDALKNSKCKAVEELDGILRQIAARQVTDRKHPNKNSLQRSIQDGDDDFLKVMDKRRKKTEDGSVKDKKKSQEIPNSPVKTKDSNKPLPAARKSIKPCKSPRHTCDPKSQRKDTSTAAYSLVEIKPSHKNSSKKTEAEPKEKAALGSLHSAADQQELASASSVEVQENPAYDTLQYGVSLKDKSDSSEELYSEVQG